MLCDRLIKSVCEYKLRLTKKYANYLEKQPDCRAWWWLNNMDIEQLVMRHFITGNTDRQSSWLKLWNRCWCIRVHCLIPRFNLCTSETSFKGFFLWNCYTEILLYRLYFLLSLGASRRSRYDQSRHDQSRHSQGRTHTSVVLHARPGHARPLRFATFAFRSLASLSIAV